MGRDLCFFILNVLLLNFLIARNRRHTMKIFWNIFSSLLFIYWLSYQWNIHHLSSFCSFFDFHFQPDDFLGGAVKGLNVIFFFFKSHAVWFQNSASRTETGLSTKKHTCTRHRKSQPRQVCSPRCLWTFLSKDTSFLSGNRTTLHFIACVGSVGGNLS